IIQYDARHRRLQCDRDAGEAGLGVRSHECAAANNRRSPRLRSGQALRLRSLRSTLRRKTFTTEDTELWFLYRTSSFTSRDAGWVVLSIGKTPDMVSLQCIHERVRLVASEGAGLRFGPFALGPPPVSDPPLRFGSRRGLQAPALSARTPRKKISLISRAMVSAPGSTRGLYHVYSQFIIPKSPMTAVRVLIPPAAPAFRPMNFNPSALAKSSTSPTQMR